MPFLFLLLSLAAGAFIGWLTILAGIWFTMPIFLVCAAIVSISLGSQFRWRLAAFSVGVIAIFAVQASTFVRQIETQQQIQKGQEKEQERKSKQKQLEMQKQRVR